MSLQQTFEKLDSAVLALVSEDVSLHERLNTAIDSITSLKEKDLAPDCRSEFKQLIVEIQTYRVSGDRGDLQPVLARSIYDLLKKFMGVTSWGAL